MRRRTMALPLLFILLLIGTMACQPPIKTPAGSIVPYTPAQQKALEKWELRNRVEQQQRLSPQAVETYIHQQLRHRFPQPLVRYRAGCRSEFDCNP